MLRRSTEEIELARCSGLAIAPLLEDVDLGMESTSRQDFLPQTAYASAFVAPCLPSPPRRSSVGWDVLTIRTGEQSYFNLQPTVNMSGRGKGGKGLGKGGAKRHRKVLRDNIQGITKPAIRRLARRGGVKRISGLIYEETRGVLKVFLENVIRDSVTYTEHARRKTVTAMGKFAWVLCLC